MSGQEAVPGAVFSTITNFEAKTLVAGVKARDEKIARLKVELRDLQDILVQHDRAAETMGADIRKQVFESLGVDTSTPEATAVDIAAILAMLKARSGR